MSEYGIYGITQTGPNIKRFDVILDEIHGGLTERFGYNTQLNPKSYLNVLVTNFADKIAELWELGEECYHAMYPFSAEGVSLDNAVQYGGITRENARPTYYHISCTCVDGTVIPKGAIIRSDTNPEITLLCSKDTLVTRESFTRAAVRPVSEAGAAASVMTVVLDSEQYSGSALEEIAGLINKSNAAFLCEMDDGILNIAGVNPRNTHSMVLSGNLTTETVTGLVTFGTEDMGEAVLPENSIIKIGTAITGLLAVTNEAGYILGRLLETDAGLRVSYADKIFHRSYRMIESVVSSILRNVQGITAIKGYQNDTNIVDGDGRWPHSIEVVVEGGGDYEVALQIWEKKTDGIQTFGGTEAIVLGDEGEPVTIRFNRPKPVYVWFKVGVTMGNEKVLPPNYADAITGIILKEMKSVAPGERVNPERFKHPIYSDVPGIDRVSLPVFYTTDANETPAAYEDRAVGITPRQRAVTDASKIEVVIDG